MNNETTINELKEFIKKEITKDYGRVLTASILTDTLKWIEKLEEEMGR